MKSAFSTSGALEVDAEFDVVGEEFDVLEVLFDGTEFVADDVFPVFPP